MPVSRHDPERMFDMFSSRVFFIPILAVSLTASAFGFSVDTNEEQKHVDFLAAYNEQPARKRIAAIAKLERSKDQRSIETLYSVSTRDPDPEVRSRAFFALVHCDDEYGYTAYLAAASFKKETEEGVKVEKAVRLGALRYKWAALNELVLFLHSLRWNPWQWNSYSSTSGYIAAGDPPESPGETTKPVPPPPKSGYPEWQNREPLRWRSEEELIGLVTKTINGIAGTQMESRPRIDQEIVKWWERKGDLWLDYDRQLRAKTQAKAQEVKFKDVAEIRAEDIRPDAVQNMLAKNLEQAKGGKPPLTPLAQRKLSGPEDE